MSYQPPYSITPAILKCIEEIGEVLGQWSVSSTGPDTPRLRRANRIKTIQASLEIENNTLDLEQITALMEGKRVLGSPREIQEVKGAFSAYEALDQWTPNSVDDLLQAHRLLMDELVDQAGAFRQKGVGITKGKEVVHVAPPANRVLELMKDLMAWLKKTDEHPLVSSCVFHYEFEFIHPFMDGNGRLGRLWQTLILSQWKPIFAWLPVETVIRDRQTDYYDALSRADQSGNATVFVEFMLGALLVAMKEVVDSDHVSDHLSDHVKTLVVMLGKKALGAPELMEKLSLKHRPSFRTRYLQPALEAGIVEMTEPDSPRSRNQKYRLTVKGLAVLESGEK